MTEKPNRLPPIGASWVPLKSAVHSMKDVEGPASGPKNSRPPVGSPHPTGVPMVAVLIFARLVGRDRNRSKSVPAVVPSFVSVN